MEQPATGPGDLSHLYPSGWNRGAVPRGETANGTACVLYRDHNGARAGAYLAHVGTGMPMHVFEHADGGWGYRPLAVREAVVAWLAAPTRDNPGAATAGDLPAGSPIELADGRYAFRLPIGDWLVFDHEGIAGGLTCAEADATGWTRLAPCGLEATA